MRLTNPGARREAITSRPWLMSSVGRRTEHAGQTTLMRVSVLLQGWVAEQLGGAAVWQRGGDHLYRRHRPTIIAPFAWNHANEIG